MTPLLNLIIKTKRDTLFSGMVKSVTTKNSKGELDVLPLHSNYMTLIKDYIVLDTGAKFPIEKGLMVVVNNKVEIFVGL